MAVSPEIGNTLRIGFCRHWDVLMSNTVDATEDQCLRFLETLSFSPRFFVLSDMCFKELTLRVVHSTLDGLPTAGAPGIDGIPASISRVFSDVFCPRPLDARKVYVNGGAPSYDLLMVLMYMIPKTKNSVVVFYMRPIFVGNTRQKCIIIVVLISIQDILLK